MLLLSTAFFPSVEYLALIASGMTVPENPSGTVIASRVYLEAHENYQKQSWRNRCRFLSASGPEDFSYPVVRPALGRPITEVKVDYSVPWVTRFKRALVSAYESSPFFDFYKDSLFEVLDSRPKTLFELNTLSLEYLLEKLKIACEISRTESFAVPGSEGCPRDDYRYVIHPKRPSHIMADLGLDRPYWQVFSGRFGFCGGLSALDLLFNEGPEAMSYLRTRAHF